MKRSTPAIAILVALGLFGCAQAHFFGLGRHRLQSFKGSSLDAILGDVHPERAQLLRGATLNIENYFSGAVLDNFAPVRDHKFWKQRYFVNDTLWVRACARGIVFLARFLALTCWCATSRAAQGSPSSFMWAGRAPCRPARLARACSCTTWR